MKLLDKHNLNLEYSIPVTNGRDNYIYCPDYIIKFIEKSMPFLPLWTQIISQKVGIIGRPTNAFIESWFRIVKECELEGKTNRKCGRFISVMRQKSRKCHQRTF